MSDMVTWRLPGMQALADEGSSQYQRQRQQLTDFLTKHNQLASSLWPEGSVGYRGVGNKHNGNGEAMLTAMARYNQATQGGTDKAQAALARIGGIWGA
ncbi:MAG: hypothetical protein GEV07_20790 [Streptosporangiales bacterium]|nr:hypothetical protein [Streptosporangiales bacterium]